jgi:hypothetical protein
MPSQWSTVYNIAAGNPGVQSMLMTAQANALPRGNAYQLGKNGFRFVDKNRYSLDNGHGHTAALVYSFSQGGWEVTCPELNLNKFYDRHLPALQIKTDLLAAMAREAL